MYLALWLRARIRIECVIAVFPIGFTPGGSRLSVAPVAQKIALSSSHILFVSSDRFSYSLHK